jgi:hypothetical protein
VPSQSYGHGEPEPLRRRGVMLQFTQRISHDYFNVDAMLQSAENAWIGSPTTS